jgi:3-hydroxybutyryl-CoA dehydrogenase
VCLLRAHQKVTLLKSQEPKMLLLLEQYSEDLRNIEGEIIDISELNIISSIDKSIKYDIVIAVTNEDVDEKTALIKQLESYVSQNVIIAINTESIALSTLQSSAQHPERIIGANWVEPAHTTYFLEIICNANSDDDCVNRFYNSAKELWQKDPYLIRRDVGIRARMMCALIREAFYLIENDYVSIEDIDRACRNDAGYYLPFAGNFRYMDLMGTYMYGIVMHDLNPELSNSTHIPLFCQQLIDDKSLGMKNGRGFYSYKPGEAEEWEKTFRNFTYKIHNIIRKYASIQTKEIAFEDA